MKTSTGEKDYNDQGKIIQLASLDLVQEVTTEETVPLYPWYNNNWCFDISGNFLGTEIFCEFGKTVDAVSSGPTNIGSTA